MPRVVENIIRLSLALGCAAALSMAPAHSRELREVKDPHYGEVLFHFYQQNYFSALTTLMTAQHFERLPHHNDEAELLRGGMLLSYGLHRQAGEIFQALIDAGAAPAVRDRAWFYLAKIRHQRGYLAEAEEAMSRIQGRLPGDLEDERRVLHALMLQREGRHAEAVAALRQASLRSSWAAYGRYNLGVALIQAGDRDAGVTLLDELGRDRARGEEMAALRDKANVALAFAFLQSETPARAKPYLDRVRMNGLMSNKALLGLGWTHAALNQPERALVPWSELAQRATVDTAVQESLLAVPFAYGKLGAHKQSLAGYELALAAYSREIERLDQSIEAIRRGSLVENIIRNNPGDESGWFWRISRLPDTPESRYLAELLASHAFQEGMKNYRDLRFLADNIGRWTQQSAIYRDMLATRRQGYTERLPRVTAGEHALDIERLRAARTKYVEELERIEREEDAGALASDKEQALAARLERLRRGAGTLTDAEQRAQMQEKQRLLSGLLNWDLSAKYPERLWQAQKGMKEADSAFTEAEKHRFALDAARTDVPESFGAFENRIAGMDSRIRGLQTQVADISREQENYLAELAVDELTHRRENIVAYVTQARFAVAQIYDEAVRAKEKTQ